MSSHILSPLKEFRPRNSYIDLEIGLGTSFETPPLFPKLLLLFHRFSKELSPTEFAYSSVLSPYGLEVLLVSSHRLVSHQSQYFLVAGHETDLDDTWKTLWIRDKLGGNSNL